MISAVIWMINLVPFCCQIETRESDLALKELVHSSVVTGSLLLTRKTRMTRPGYNAGTLLNNSV